MKLHKEMILVDDDVQHKQHLKVYGNWWCGYVGLMWLCSWLKRWTEANNIGRNYFSDLLYDNVRILGGQLWD